MIGYLTLGSADPVQAAQFFDPLMAELGAKQLWQMPRGIAWGAAFDKPTLALMQPFDGQPPTVGNGTMVAFQVADAATVQRVHAKALALGGSSEGEPGERTKGFYGGYFRSPEGHKFCVYCYG